MHHHKLNRALGALAIACIAGCAGGPLHVPSPDWRDQVVYFAMVDRFADGDPANNDQGTGEYDPADPARWSGGDLAGLASRLDYIQGLGATALWITPPVANQWMNPGRSYGGYHGYWASDFRAVDAHYGTLGDYRALSRGLHARGMALVQDVVVNHVADYLDCDAGDAAPESRCRVRTDARGRNAPVRAPFDRNDPRDAAQRAAAIYHWTPSIADFGDRRQELEHQLAGLDDLDTETPAVRRALRDAYGYWIREVGVDAFRVDTAFHVPASFFPDFLHADDADAPGIERVARATGRTDFLAFGEGFGADRPYADAQARKLDGYMRTPGGLPSMIDFPLYGSLGDAFARGAPTAVLGHRIRSRMALHADPHRMPTFVDNHDVDRFLAGGSEAALKQALLAMLTLPGIPVVYYGTEQGFREPRASMFAGGFGSGGRDHFDTGAPLYRYLREAIALRREHRLFSRGTPEVLAENRAAPGAIAWRTTHAGDAALVVFNTADAPGLLDGLDTGLPAGTRLHGLFGIDGRPGDLVVGADGRLDLVLPARSGQVWHVGGRGAVPPGPADTPTLAPLASSVQVGDFEVQGTAPGAREVRVVVDGSLAGLPVPVDADGRWRTRVRTGGMVDPAIPHRVVAWTQAGGASDAQAFTVAHDWRLLADVADPRGDDHGPSGRYAYPDDAGWRAHGPADIERIRVFGAAGALRIEVTLRELVSTWNPANGFDHVALTAFLELPGRDGGVAAMPQQHATLPGGMRWHYRLRAHGWSNVLFAADGAHAQHEGTPVSPGAELAVDATGRTITFTVPANALGMPESLSGARLYLSSWDYDGGYRPLAPVAGPATFGGGAADAPRVMDDVPPIRLP